MEQSQFLDVIHRDEAERRFHAALDLAPLGRETVALDEALGRVLAEDLRSDLDIPGFTRSNVDGFAVRAADTFGCDEATPRELELNEENLATGLVPTVTVEPQINGHVDVAAVLVGQEAFDAVRDPAHGSAEFARRPGNQDIFRIDAAFHAERAADVTGDDVNVILG